MAKDKKGFVLYADQKEVFEELPDDYAGKLIKHIFKYVNDENPTTDDLVLKIAFSPIKAQLKRDLKKYEEKSLIRSEIGRQGGLASGEARRAKANQKEPIGSNVKQNEQDTVNDTVIDKDIFKRVEKKFLDFKLNGKNKKVGGSILVTESFVQFMIHRENLNKPLDKMSAQLIFTQLENISRTPLDAIAILNQAIRGGYTDIRPLQ